MKRGKKEKDYNDTAQHPINKVYWVNTELILANDYNPNVVAPIEMELLEISIRKDGFTQPIVVWRTDNNHYEVVDGFHRHLVGKKLKMKQLPVTIINADRTGRGDRIASTIRHNRARGKHTVEGMSDIVLELKNRNWTNERIAKNLGMEQDEILRLCQITGLADLFKDQDFSKAWDLEDSEPDFEPISDDIKEDIEGFRTINTDDKDRIFHHYTKWECYQAGLYNTTKDGMTREQCEYAYRDFLSDIKRFSNALQHIIVEWKHSCEHYLTNIAMNRIAWLGQAAMCYETGVPAVFRGGFNLLSDAQQKKANETALIYLNKWLETNNRQIVTMEEALSDKQMDLY